jgi:hypothetical protein
MGARRVNKITLLEVFTLFVKVGTTRTTTSFAAVVLPLKASLLMLSLANGVGVPADAAWCTSSGVFFGRSV